MKIRVKAVFGNPQTELTAKAIDGEMFGNWTDAIDEDAYNTAVEKFLIDHPECSNWNISIEKQD